MIDAFGRGINYLRISVTDRCNLRCGYCMPPEGIKLLRHEDILSFEQIVDVTKAAASAGVATRKRAPEAVRGTGDARPRRPAAPAVGRCRQDRPAVRTTKKEGARSS